MANSNTESFLYGTDYFRQTLADKTSKKRITYGLDFPIGGGGKGYFSKISGIDLIKKNLRQLLLTEKGSRVMLPNYGVALRKYLFEPIDEKLFNEIRKDISTSIFSYAKDVVIKKLSILQEDENSGNGGNALHILLIAGIRDSDVLFETKVRII